jgi:predicted esterase
MARNHGGRLLAVACPALLVGCTWRAAPASDRGVTGPPPATIAWPARRTDDLDAIASAMPRRLRTPMQFRMISADDSVTSHVELVAVYDVLDARPAGMGVVRRLRSTRVEDERILLDFQSFLPQAAPPEEIVGDGTLSAAEFLFGTEHMELRPPRGPESRGLVIYLRSLTGTEYEREVIDRFQDEGWWVLDVRFALLRSKGIDVPVIDTEQPDAAAVVIAAYIDHRLAEYAYAVEGALSYLAAEHSEVVEGPVVAVGFSKGAIVLTPVVARSLDRIDAAVLVAGGANILRIARTSHVDLDELRVTDADGNALSGRDEGRLFDVYQQRSALDPYATAPALTRMPVLMVHGAFDAVVPARTGDVLHRRLGRPERWTCFGGHSVVFWLLPRLAAEIIQWVERATAPPG